MSSGSGVANRASFGMLGYLFVGLTAVVMVMAVAVVLADVNGRAPHYGAPADLSSVQR